MSERTSILLVLFLALLILGVGSQITRPKAPTTPTGIVIPSSTTSVPPLTLITASTTTTTLPSSTLPLGNTITGPIVVDKTSEGLLPGDLANLYGDNLGNFTMVTVDGIATPVVNSNPGNNFITIRIPPTAPAGAFQIQLKNNVAASSTPVTINNPQPNWLSEPQGYPGMQMTLFGRNLDGRQLGIALGTKILVGNTVINPTTVNPYAVSFIIPASIAPGAYTVSVQNIPSGPWMALTDTQLTVLQPSGSDPLNLGVSWAHAYHWNNITSIVNFGAKGDGATDDTTAIQDAINQVSAGGGGVVMFPSGTYLYSKQIQLLSGVVLMGEDKSTTVLKYEGIGGIDSKAPIYNSGDDGVPGVIGIADLTLTVDPAELATTTNLIFIGSDDVRSASEISGFKMSKIFLYNNILTVPVDEQYMRAIKVNVIGDTLAADNTFSGFGMGYSDYSEQYITIRDNTFNLNGSQVETIGSYIIVTNNNLVAVATKPNQAHGFFQTPDSGAVIAHVYYSGNTSSAKGSGGDGEAFSTDGATLFVSGQVASSEGTNITITPDCETSASNINWPLQKQMGIISGKGVGQVRTIVSNIGNTSFTLARPWDIQPDSTSLAMVTEFNSDLVYYDNTISNSTVGMQLYTTGYDVVWDDNTITNAPSAITAYDEQAAAPYSRCPTPVYFADISHNTFSETNANTLLTFMTDDLYDKTASAFPLEPTTLEYGMELRHNLFSGTNAANQQGITFRIMLANSAPYAVAHVVNGFALQLGALLDQNTFSSLPTTITLDGPQISYTTILPVAGGTTLANLIDASSTATQIINAQ